MEELFVPDRILLTDIFQIQVPVVLVPRSPVKTEESATMGMTENTIVPAEVDSQERTVRMVSHNLTFLTSSNTMPSDCTVNALPKFVLSHMMRLWSTFNLLS